jgi:hypothetical protein
MSFSEYIRRNSKYATYPKIVNTNRLIMIVHELNTELDNIRNMIMANNCITLIDKLELTFLKHKKKQLLLEYKRARKNAKEAEVIATIAYYKDLEDYRENSGNYYTLIRTNIC